MNNEKRNVLAIIPARGGSKRLPRKNILPLAGKPLIGWTIEAALESELFDQVMVNTDDLDIAQISKSFGASIPFIRPDILANDTASSIDVIKHTLNYYQKEGVYFTDIVFLQPTSPLRDAADIQAAWDIYIDKQSTSLTAVCEVEHPIQWTYKLEKESKLVSLFDDNAKRSQDYDKNYRINGAIYITSVINLMECNSLISECDGIAYEMSHESSIDIDNLLDFKFAELLLTEKLS